MIKVDVGKTAFSLIKLIFISLLLIILFGGVVFWIIVLKSVNNKSGENEEKSMNVAEEKTTLFFNEISSTITNDIAPTENRFLLTDFAAEASEVNRLIDIKEYQQENKDYTVKSKTALALDQKTHDYFNFYAYMYDSKNGDYNNYWSLDINSNVAYGDKQLISKMTDWSSLKFSRMDLSKCGISSFMAKSGVMFLFCLGSFDQVTSEAKVDFFVLSQTELDINIPEGALEVIFSGNLILSGSYGGIDQYKGNFFNQEIKVMSINKNKFYVFTNKEIFVIQVKDGNLILTKTIPIEVYVPLYQDGLVTLKKSTLNSLWFVKYYISPSAKYIYFISNGGGVIDTTQDKILIADNSCVKLTGYPKDEYNDSYKNDYIDPFSEEAYKIPRLKYWDEKNNLLAVSQGFSSGGGYCNDGDIYLYLGKDTFKCEIRAKLVCKSYN